MYLKNATLEKHQVLPVTASFKPPISPDILNYPTFN
jgi:hypothetical protein